MKNSIKEFGSLKEAIEYIDSLVFKGKTIPVKVKSSHYSNSNFKFLNVLGIKVTITTASYSSWHHPNTMKGKLSCKEYKFPPHREEYTVSKNQREQLFGTAVHEVRHRAQTLKNAIITAKEMAILTNKIWWDILKENGCYFVFNLCKLDLRELDAIIIETIAEKLKNRLSEEDLKRLILCNSALGFLEKRNLSL